MLKTYHKWWRDGQSVIMAEMKVKGAYNALLFGLALSVPSASIPSATEQETLHLLQDQKQPAGDTQQQEFKKRSQPVPPLAAPAQKEFVPQLTSTNNKRRKCCNAAFGCHEYADVCRGFRPELCTSFLEGRISLPSKELQETERQNERKKRYAAAAAEKR